MIVRREMGHVKDTEHVRDIERRYNRKLVGYSAFWYVYCGEYRTEIFDGKWCGVFPLNKDDLEVYNVADAS